MSNDIAQNSYRSPTTDDVERVSPSNFREHSGILESVQHRTYKEMAVQENVINRVNRGGSVHVEFIVSAGQVLGTIDSSQESELGTTM